MLCDAEGAERASSLVAASGEADNGANAPNRDQIKDKRTAVRACERRACERNSGDGAVSTTSTVPHVHVSPAPRLPVCSKFTCSLYQ